MSFVTLCSKFSADGDRIPCAHCRMNGELNANSDRNRVHTSDMLDRETFTDVMESHLDDDIGRCKFHSIARKRVLAQWCWRSFLGGLSLSLVVLSPNVATEIYDRVVIMCLFRLQDRICISQLNAKPRKIHFSPDIYLHEPNHSTILILTSILNYYHHH